MLQFSYVAQRNLIRLLLNLKISRLRRELDSSKIQKNGTVAINLGPSVALQNTFCYAHLLPEEGFTVIALNDS